MKSKSFLLFLLLSLSLPIPRITLAVNSLAVPSQASVASSVSTFVEEVASAFYCLFNTCKKPTPPTVTKVYVPTYITPPPPPPPSPPQVTNTTIVRTSPPSVTNTYPTYYAPPYPPTPTLPSTGYITASQLQEQVTAIYDFIRRQAEQTGSDAINNSNNGSTFDPSTLTTSSIAEGTNLYYTDARVSAFLSGTTTVSSAFNYWTKTGTDLTYTLGNVGVGTTTPAATFSIAGTAGGTSPVFLISTSTSAFSTTTALIVTSLGAVGIGTSNPVAKALEVVSSRDDVLISTGYGPASGGIVGRKANGTEASPTAILSTNVFFNITGRGYNGSAFSSNNTSIFFQASQDWTTTANGSRMTFNVTPNNSVARREVMRIENDGKVGIGTTSPNWLLQLATTSASSNMQGQLALTDSGAGTNLKHWLFSSMRGNLYIGTTTDAYATSTPAALTILNNGNVGIGGTNSNSTLYIASTSQGFDGQAVSHSSIIISPTASYAGQSWANRVAFAITGSQNLTSSITNPNSATRSYADHGGSGTVTALSGLSARVDNDGGGTVTNAIGVQTERMVNSTNSTITNLYGAYMGNLTNTVGSTITNTYGVYVADYSAAGTQTNMPYSFYASDVNTWNYFAGNTGMGTTSPYAKLSVASTVIGSTTMALRPIASQTANILDIYSTAGVLNSVINSNGNLGLGTTTPSARLALTQSANTAAGGLWIAETGNTDFRSLFMDTAGTLSFFGGNTAGTLNTATLSDVGAWINASDRIYKENIADLNTKYSLSDLMKLEPRFYTMKGTGKPQIGFIAQEVKSVIPEVVEGVDGSMGISYGNLVAMAVQGVKDMYGILQSLIQKVNGFGSEFTTKKLCVEDVCVTKEEFKKILLQANINSAFSGNSVYVPTPIPISISTTTAPEATSTDNSSTTPVIADPTITSTVNTETPSTPSTPPAPPAPEAPAGTEPETATSP